MLIDIKNRLLFSKEPSYGAQVSHFWTHQELHSSTSDIWRKANPHDTGKIKNDCFLLIGESLMWVPLSCNWIATELTLYSYHVKWKKHTPVKDRYRIKILHYRAFTIYDETEMTFDKVQTQLSKHTQLLFYCITEPEYIRLLCLCCSFQDTKELFFKMNIANVVT